VLPAGQKCPPGQGKQALPGAPKVPARQGRALGATDARPEVEAVGDWEGLGAALRERVRAVVAEPEGARVALRCALGEPLDRMLGEPLRCALAEAAVLRESDGALVAVPEGGPPKPRVALLCCEALREPLRSALAEAEGVPPETRVALRRGEALPAALAEPLRRVLGDALRRALTEALQVGGGRERPVVVQPAQGQGVGAPLPAGQ
jgi:hypothetical protein